MSDTPAPLITNERSPEEIIKSMSEANNEMARKLGLSLAQLKKDKEKFEFYAAEHRKKETADGDAKARTNFEMAEDIQAVIDLVTSL